MDTNLSDKSESNDKFKNFEENDMYNTQNKT